MTLDDLIPVLTESILANGGTKELVAKAIADLRAAAEEAKQERATAGPKAKTQLAIIVSDPDGRLKGLNLTGWVIQLEESAPPQEAYTRLVAATNDYNNSKRGRRKPLETLGQAIQTLRGKWLRQEGGRRLTIPKSSRDPIAIQSYPNKLPR